MSLRLLLGLAVVAATAAPPAETECCFTNPRYSGLCRVAPGEGETCQTVLEYLNNPLASGKGYCGGTDIRGGWTQASCTKPTPTPTPPAGAGARTRR